MESNEERGGRRAVVLTTDCGTEMDDQWAIAHLALCEDLDLRGIVTNHAPNLAPPASETAARFVAEVLDQLSLTGRPPVVAGSSGPLPDGRTASPNAGVEFIIEQACGRSADDRLVVLAIGTATDVASALLLDPAIVDRIEVVAMGFDAWPGGGDAWNVKNDIPAWQTVMASGVPITVGDAAVCIKRLTLDGEGAAALLAGSGAAGEFLVRLLADWLAAEEPMARMVTGRVAWPVWDEIVVAHLLGLTAKETYPRPVVKDDMTFDQSAADADRTIGWITDVDADRLWSDLARRLQSM